MMLLVGLVLVGACAGDDDDSMDLVNGGAGNTATGGTTAMSATGGGGGKGSAGMSTGGTGGSGTTGSGGSGAGGAASAGTGGSAGAGSGGAGGMGSGGATAGSGGAAAGTGGATGGNTPGTVSVEFTTVSYGGEYAPKNYVAVWFESSGGDFIKTAARWAGAAHATDLPNWTEASGGWGSPFLGGGNMADMMDAMSSATLQMHGAHTVMWNMKDADMMLVADGEYQAVIEMTEDRARANSAVVLRIPFTKGPAPETVDVPDEDSLTGIVLKYTP
jgi:hypothetical protein